MYPQVSCDQGWIFILIRDDLLKLVYPNPLTQKEIEDIYLQYGKFTREQVFDVPIKSR